MAHTQSQVVQAKRISASFCSFNQRLRALWLWVVGDLGVSLSKSCWAQTTGLWPSHSGFPHLPGHQSFCSVTKPVTMGESIVCRKLILAALKTFLIGSDYETSLFSSYGKSTSSQSLVQHLCFFSLWKFSPFLPVPQQQKKYFSNNKDQK